MAKNIEIFTGLIIAIIFAFFDYKISFSVQHFFWFIYATALISLIFGCKLRLFIRIFISGIIFYYSFWICLTLRTWEPGNFRVSIIEVPIIYTCIYAFPVLSFTRIWQGKLRSTILITIFPLTFILACMLATYEEYEFVKQHPTGIGPTPRWTISDSWLAYDAKNKKLYGSD